MGPLDRMIEEVRYYGPMPLEQLIQRILDDNETGVTLRFVSPTGWETGEFWQAKGFTVWEAISAKAAMVGYELRYLPDDMTVLTLHSPKPIGAILVQDEDGDWVDLNNA